MAQEAVVRAPSIEPLAPYAAQIYAATANASFAEKIAAALNAEGIDIVNGDYAQSGAAAVVVVWSGASIGSRRLVAAARSPLAAGALIPISIGRVEPPDGFRHLQPVDLAGWTGSSSDPRWRFVVDELRRIALLKERERLASAPERRTEGSGFESWFDGAFVDEAKGKSGRLEMGSESGAESGERPEPGVKPSVLRTNAKPLVMAGAAVGTLLFLAFAGLTILRNPGPPQPAPSQAPALTQIAPAPERPVDREPVLAEETAVVAAAPPARAPDGAEDDRIAALIVENSVPPDAGPAGAVLVQPTEGPQLFRDCADCPELARIPAGTFTMGPGPSDVAKPGEGPAVEVNISKPFAMARTETTVGEWRLCVADGACPALPGVSSANAPAVNVSWSDARAYAEWLSKKTGRRYRLPSEAEWEYAARAGAETPFAFGASVSAHQASFDGALPFLGEGGATLKGPLPVETYAANAFGLYDMHGNAWEWTQDCWASSHSGAPTDGAPRAGACTQRVLKGGAWNTGGWRLRAAHRIGKPQTAREYDNGFRVVRDLP